MSLISSKYRGTTVYVALRQKRNVWGPQSYKIIVVTCNQKRPFCSVTWLLQVIFRIAELIPMSGVHLWKPTITQLVIHFLPPFTELENSFLCCVLFEAWTEVLNMYITFGFQNFTNYRFRRNISKLKLLIECSKTLLSFTPCCTFHISTSSTSEHLTVSSTHLYKYERALPRNLPSRKFLI